MKRIRSQNTSIEKIIVKIVKALGYKININVTSLPGKPDIVYERKRKTIFVHGCFWHGHNCNRASIPKTNRVFWKNKIENNIRRDRRVRRQLSKIGWKSLVVWQCQITKSKEESLAKRLKKYLSNAKG